MAAAAAVVVIVIIVVMMVTVIVPAAAGIVVILIVMMMFVVVTALAGIVVIIIVMMMFVVVTALAGVVIVVMMFTGRLCFVRLSDIRPAFFRFVFFVFVVAHGINLRTIQSLLKRSTVKDKMLEKPFGVNVYSSDFARFGRKAISLFVQVFQSDVDD